MTDEIASDIQVIMSRPLILHKYCTDFANVSGEKATLMITVALVLTVYSWYLAH